MSKQAHNTKDNWIPLLEYALKKNISVSTLRRHIKMSKVLFKIENGRYLLWDGAEEEASIPLDPLLLQSALIQMETDLKNAREEIAELKTLIALYEEKIPSLPLNS